MTVLTKRATAAVTPSSSDDDPNGAFDLLLSISARDRDGETLRPQDWAQPPPDVIPINLDHSSQVSDVIGSGRPFIDEQGNLRVQGSFASTPQAQHIRTLVNEGHLRSVSVEFLKRKDGNRTIHELVGVPLSTCRPTPRPACSRRKLPSGTGLTPSWRVSLPLTLSPSRRPSTTPLCISALSAPRLTPWLLTQARTARTARTTARTRPQRCGCG